MRSLVFDHPIVHACTRVCLGSAAGRGGELQRKKHKIRNSYKYLLFLPKCIIETKYAATAAAAYWQ